jgi:cation transport regulator
MPYQSTADLPEGVQEHLPQHAQEIYLAAYNNATKEYANPGKRRGNETLEEVTRKVAWAAVKKDYIKDPISGAWREK